MIIKVRHCCLQRLPRYCAKSLLTSRAFNLMAVLHPGASKNQCHQSSRLVSMLLNGIDLKDNDCADSQRVFTVSQTILFNYNTKPTSSAIKFQHSTNREPPLPLFIGLKVHTETRSKKMIMHLYNIGLSVSYYSLRISLQMQSVKISV